MHIPDSMLQGSVCPVTAVVSAIGIATAAYYGMKTEKPLVNLSSKEHEHQAVANYGKQDEKPSASQFAAITALLFAGQMMNFPIMDGTSGHLLGGVLASTLLGTPFGVLSVALVVVLQSLVFSDGGVTVLGANLLNMAIIGAGLGGLLRTSLAARWQSSKGTILATAVAAWASVVLASFATSVELAIDGQIVFSSVVTAMVATHALIGIGEAIITVVACFLLTVPTSSSTKTPHGQVVVPLTAATVIALLLSPFASGFPDGLEWVAEKYQFLHESAPTFVGPLPDYSASFIGNEMLSTGFAGLIGVMLSFASAWALHRLINLFVTRSQIA